MATAKKAVRPPRRIWFLLEHHGLSLRYFGTKRAAREHCGPDTRYRKVVGPYVLEERSGR